MLKSVLAAAAAATLLAGLAGCNTNPFGKTEQPMQVAPGLPAYPMNGALVTPGGLTLYTFDKDTVNAATSACSGPCAALWPPLPAAANATATGNFTVVKREDGSQQWAYKGWPVYTYSKDTRSGDKLGDNFKDIWHVAKP